MLLYKLIICFHVLNRRICTKLKKTNKRVDHYCRRDLTRRRKRDAMPNKKCLVFFFFLFFLIIIGVIVICLIAKWVSRTENNYGESVVMYWISSWRQSFFHYWFVIWFLDLSPRSCEKLLTDCNENLWVGYLDFGSESELGSNQMIHSMCDLQ